MDHTEPLQADPQQSELETILQRYGRRKDSLIPILQEIQKRYRYLPEQLLQQLCRETEITPADVVGVAGFYDQFRFKPIGKHSLCVCTGTACHVKGAGRVLDAFHQVLEIPPHEDTDPQGDFTIQKVACLGCCTLAPVVQIDGVTYGHVTTGSVADVLEDFKNRRSDQPNDPIQTGDSSSIASVRIGLGSCCQAQGAAAVRDEIARVIKQWKLPIKIEPVGCVGMCHQTPLLETVSKKGVSVFYARVTPEDVSSILLGQFKSKRWFHHWEDKLFRLAGRIWSDEFPEPAQARRLDTENESVRSFLETQCHCAMEHCGQMNPSSLDDYRKHGGYDALQKILSENTGTAELIERLKTTGLRGRGGAGFPTHLKWQAVYDAQSIDDEQKFIVCNGDEGDPGAFMDRMLLESFPYRVIEGITIAAKAVGAQQGFLYIRAEYPLAVTRIKQAIETCYQAGLLGENILNSGLSFNLEVKEGAGAFVCGEETALLESIEGRRGMPRIRPPYPAQKGLFGKPTLINNVETFSLIPYLFGKNGQHFEQLGTQTSRGTKVFALAGKVKRGGLIEVPMGMTVRQIVQQIGGGVPGGKQFKAVQIGGPSGGCIPAELADTPVDFQSLARLGAIMGSGGLVVLDEDDCMVDIARYFLAFTQEQSCGKCTFCRVGTRRMLEIMQRICQGKGQHGDLEKLETLATQVGNGSLCGLGKTAPNPVLSTLKYFRSEYEAHLQGRCPAGKCTELVQYRIEKNCNGCSICAKNCPVQAIEYRPYRIHEINNEKCTRCDTCRQLCPANAVIIGPKKSTNP